MTAQALASKFRRALRNETGATFTRDQMIELAELGVLKTLAETEADAAWGQFIKILCDKAESAGCKVVKVDPRRTSQTCPKCGVVEPKSLKERVHSCPCGFTADRDVAAAQVIVMRAVSGPPGANVAGCGARSPRKAVDEMCAVRTPGGARG